MNDNSAPEQKDREKADYTILVKDVYTYQSKSKIDQLPKWAKIAIAVVLVLVAIGAVVGGAFAINAVANMTQAPTPAAQAALVAPWP